MVMLALTWPSVSFRGRGKCELLRVDNGRDPPHSWNAHHQMHETKPVLAFRTVMLGPLLLIYEERCKH